MKNKIKVLVLVLLLLVSFAGCSSDNSGSGSRSSSEEFKREDSGDISSVSPTPASIFEEKGATLYLGNTFYDGFRLDNVLHFQDDTEDLHFNLYIPDSYTGYEEYALYIALPGYGGFYFQGVGENLFKEGLATEGRYYNDRMIVAAPQPEDWEEMSMRQTIGLTEYMLANFNIDRNKVYIAGYSSGGQTLSYAVSARPDLYTAALIISSWWEGELKPVADAHVPVYFAQGADDELYGSYYTESAYNDLKRYYIAEGLPHSQIEKLIVLDIRDGDYFGYYGFNSQHVGGLLFAYEEDIMGWLFSQEKQT